MIIKAQYSSIFNDYTDLCLEFDNMFECNEKWIELDFFKNFHVISFNPSNRWIEVRVPNTLVKAFVKEFNIISLERRLAELLK